MYKRQILKMGTKEVLVDTQHMSWGAETNLYRSAAQLGEELPSRLAARGPLVLKRHRGMGGDGVWKVELADPSSPSPDEQSRVLVQHAVKGSGREELLLREFVGRCEPYFAGTGLMVEQPYQSRLAEGMIRAYLTHEKVVGFAHQYPRGLMPPGVDDRSTAKAFEPASEPSYGELRDRLESEWIPELREILGIETHALPVIWDADFLYGPKTSAGEDSYVLCEINVAACCSPSAEVGAGAHRAIPRPQPETADDPIAILGRFRAGIGEEILEAVAGRDWMTEPALKRAPAEGKGEVPNGRAGGWSGAPPATQDRVRLEGVGWVGAGNHQQDLAMRTRCALPHLELKIEDLLRRNVRVGERSAEGKNQHSSQTGP